MIDREARLQLALPPGGVVSRATLWVNGEEREAAYGGRGEVRAAYQQVAVQQRRDPLLVTTKGADRVLAQAFPVPRNGGTIKFKIGISAPLAITQTGKARLTLPAVIDRNFSISADAGHSIWIESRQGLNGPSGLAASEVDGRLYRISGTLDDRELSGTRQSITVDRTQCQRRGSRLGDGEAIVQEIERGEPTRTLMRSRWLGAALRNGHEDHRGARCDSSRHQGRRHDRQRANCAHPPGAVVRRPEGRGDQAPSLGVVRGRAGQCSRARRCAVGARDRVAGDAAVIHGPQPINFIGSMAR
jgi:hypothetical protein